MKDLISHLPLYKELIELLYEEPTKYKEQEVTIFTPTNGKEYKNGILFCGRAVNGWRTYMNKAETDNKEKIITDLASELSTADLQWVLDCWGNGRGKYNTKTSQFWKAVGRIASNGMYPVPSIFHKVAWTNLYKAADYHKKNPTLGLRRLQHDMAKEMLMKEIELFKPKALVMLTGWGFAWNFFNQKINRSEEYIEHVDELYGVPVVVAPHPQGKKAEPLCNAVLEELNKLNV